METNEATGTAPLTSSLKMFTLLDEVAKTDGPFGVSEIARRVGGSRSMVHRQLVTLVAAGWLTTNAQGLYTLTFTPVRLAQAALRHASLDERISDELRKLADKLGEGISLGTIDSGWVTIVSRGLPRRNVHVSLAHGQRFEIASSALGNVLASYMDDAELARLTADGVRLPDATTRKQIREAGHSVLLDDEFDPIDIVAVPVGHAIGGVRFALSAHWPHGRTSESEALSVLQEGAKAVADLTEQSSGVLSP